MFFNSVILWVMYPDVTNIYHWYKTPMGGVAEHLIAAKMSKVMGSIQSNGYVLVIGYVEPFANLWDGATVFWAAPAQMGGYPWPEGEYSRTVMVKDETLPFADNMFDAVVIAHSLEFTSSAKGLLEETKRILRPSGKVVVVAPNRLSLWARREGSPFAMGSPYSLGQLKRLLTCVDLVPKSYCNALYFPPFKFKFILKAAKVWEKIGSFCFSAIGGVVIVRAEKVIIGGKIVRAKERKFIKMPVLRPVKGVGMTKVV